MQVVEAPMTIDSELDKVELAIDFAQGLLEREMKIIPRSHTQVAIQALDTAREALRARSAERAKE